MICQRCGTYMSDDALTCDHCGTLLSDGNSRPRETGVRAIRQGRLGAMPPVLPDDSRADVPEYGDYDMSPLPLEQERSPRRKVADGAAGFASRPTTRRGVPVNPRGRVRSIATKHGKTHAVKRYPVNWMLMGMIGVVLVILVVAGYLLYMNGTDEGQRMTARNNVASASPILFELITSTDDLRKTEREEALKELNSAPAQSYWLVGQEYMVAGDVETAITSFRLADVLDPENYDGLLLLANAYELDNNDADAENIYLRLSGPIETPTEEEQAAATEAEPTGIAPSRSEAYTALIRMYLDQGRNPEAARAMLKAYENTDKEAYRLQRKDFIPNTPQVDLAAGRYMLEQTIHLSSPQGYDIYYTLDNALKLPPDGNQIDGWTYTEDGTLTIPEGSITLRAFCLSEDLVSDALSVTYTVYYPTPSAPGTNLAPATYSKPRTVSLRPGNKDDEKEHKENPYTFYYTIDGSTPTEESPVYDGTPIKLPSGKVTLKAVCVNQYGKMSPIREVGYKFTFKASAMSSYSEEDKFSGFALFSTTMDDFKTKFGAPTSETDIVYMFQEGDARHLEYSWGHAEFMLTNGKWRLVRVEMNSEIASAPRSVGFGSSESDIVAMYKDMGQLQSSNGDRGLYYADPNIGRVIQNEDGTRTVYYSCNTLESKVWVLEYHLKGDRVFKICHYYKP